MAHHKSAKKRIKSDLKKNQQNKTYLAGVRTAVKKVRVAAESKGDSKVEIGALFVHAQSLLHKAATKGIIHRNKASKQVAKLAAIVKKVSA